jgi:glycosyltransferase involved in cell wall biosynthesis
MARMHIDLVTFADGADCEFPRVRTFRVPRMMGTTEVRAGFSFKKVLSDFFLFCIAFRLCLSNKYQLIHAGDESVFVALILRIIFGIPYIYDMECLLSESMVFGFPGLKCIAPLMEMIEGVAIRHASAVSCVCETISTAVQRYSPKNLITIWDVPPQTDQPSDEDLRTELSLTDQVLALYVGGLESYHGIDLLLRSFAILRKTDVSCSLVLIGGTADLIAKYKPLAASLHLDDCVYFLGSRPVKHLQSYLAQADILVSTITGRMNFPMKVLSYLESGKCILATDLIAHRQVLNSEVSLLVPATPEDLAQGFARLAKNPLLRLQLGQRGKSMSSNFTRRHFEEKVLSLYSNLVTIGDSRIGTACGADSASLVT